MPSDDMPRGCRPQGQAGGQVLGAFLRGTVISSWVNLSQNVPVGLCFAPGVSPRTPAAGVSSQCSLVT